MIYRTRSFLNFRTLKMIFDSMAQSNVNYGNVVWASTNHFKLKQIFIKQLQILRMILYKGRQCHVRSLLRKMRALNVYQTNIFQTLLFRINSQNNDLPDAFKSFFIDLHHKYPTRVCLKCTYRRNVKNETITFFITRSPVMERI